MQHIRRLATVALVLALGGCEGTADSLGFGRNSPDEFAVVDRPPLSLPPDYDLRPPRPGAPRPQEVKMPERASQALFGGTASETTSSSDAEKALLSAAATEKAEPNIRDVIDREATQKVTGSRHLVEELLWWRDPSSASATVDPAQEAQRIKEAKEKGESVTSGATPVIEKGKSGWLGL